MGMAGGMKFHCVAAWGQKAGLPVAWLANGGTPILLVNIIANSCTTMCVWSALQWASFAAICCIKALKMAVLASLEAVDCVMMDADRFAMCALMESMNVSVVTLSEMLSSVVRPLKRLLDT